MSADDQSPRSYQDPPGLNHGDPPRDGVVTGRDAAQERAWRAAHAEPRGEQEPAADEDPIQDPAS